MKKLPIVQNFWVVRMQQKVLVPIQGSLGFALRGIRAQHDCLMYLTRKRELDVIAIVATHPVFRGVAEETFSRAGAKVRFCERGDETEILDEISIAKIAKENGIPKSLILTEENAMRYLQEDGQEQYPTIVDNLGLPHPFPNKPTIFAKPELVEAIESQLKSLAKKEAALAHCHYKKVIFIPFSGLKSLGTDYGREPNEKERIKRFMSFPFEDSIPAIGKIQEKLRSFDILAIPVVIQYGDLDSIQKRVAELSRHSGLSPAPTSLNIDWNRDLEQQVAFFHALNRWSKETGLPNIAIVHGSSCLHLVEECSDAEGMVTFFATHTEKLEPEDDGRVYHLAIAEARPKTMRVVQPPIPDSHNYRLVADQLANEVIDIFSDGTREL